MDPFKNAVASLLRHTPHCKPMTGKMKVTFIVCIAMATFTLWLSLNYFALRTPVLLSHSTRIGHLLAQPKHGDSHLFFIETSCADTSFHLPHRGLILNARQACSIESAAKTNPQATVYLLYTCAIHEDAFEASPLFIRRMLTYPNVRVWLVNFSEYFKDTPLEFFYETGAWVESKWPKEHSSDVLRLLTLWKYGGTYLDLDFVVRRSLTDLGFNYAAAETKKFLANGVLNFGTDVTGCEVAKQCLTELSTDFRADKWAYNGPGLITRVMTRRCGVNVTTEMTPERCMGFTIHPRSVFFPIMYGATNLGLLFNQSQSEEAMRRIEGSHMIHMWNKLTHNMMVAVGSRQLYGLLAQEFCPEVYYHCGSIF